MVPGEAESETRAVAMALSRRAFLRWVAAGAASGLAFSLLPDAVAQSPAAQRLADAISRAIGSRAIGFDLRRIDDEGYEQFRVQVNADQLYPVASCFKTFAVLYYCWYMPYLMWSSPDAESLLYRVAVSSSNLGTTTLLYQVAPRVPVLVPGRNAIETFNDFLIYTMRFQNGIYRWSFGVDGGDESDSLTTPPPVDTDRRFEPSLGRYVEVRGERVLMDNLFTAADLANGYAMMLAPDSFPDVDRAATAIDVTLDLHSIPFEGYESPFERAFERDYTGKDGVLPASDSPAGRVINDAGIVQFGAGRYVIAFLCLEGEFAALEVLGEIRAAIEAYEAVVG